MSRPAKKQKVEEKDAGMGLDTPVKKFLDSLGKKRGRVITLDHNQTVADAFQTLAQNKIISAPVLLSTGLEQPEDDGQYLGIVDTGTLLSHVLHLVQEKESKMKSKKDTQWEVFRDVGHDMFDTKLIVVCGRDTGFAFPDALNRSLKELITTGFLQNDQTPAHRVVVSNLRGKFTTIVTQSDVLKFVAANANTCVGKTLLAKTLQELKYLKPTEKKESVVSIHEDDKAIEGFWRIKEKGVSGIAVVNKEGELTGNLSASDLRGMKVTDFSHLLDTVKGFLVFQKTVREGRSDFLWQGHMECFALQPSAPLSALLETFKTTRVHRLYVVNEKNQPIAVISLTDVLRFLSA